MEMIEAQLFWFLVGLLGLTLAAGGVILILLGLAFTAYDRLHNWACDGCQPEGVWERRQRWLRIFPRAWRRWWMTPAVDGLPYTARKLRALMAWEPSIKATEHDRVIYDELVIRGMVVGHVEAFYESGPWYPWCGEHRFGAYSNLAAARERVEGAACDLLLRRAKLRRFRNWVTHKVYQLRYWWDRWRDDDDDDFTIEPLPPYTPNDTAPLDADKVS